MQEQIHMEELRDKGQRLKNQIELNGRQQIDLNDSEREKERLL